MPITLAEVTELRTFADQRVKSPDIADDQWQDYFNVTGIKRAVTQIETEEAMTAVRFKPEMQEADEAHMEKGYRKRMNKITFAAFIALTREARRLGTIDKYAKMVDAMPEAFDYNSNVFAAGLYDNGNLQNSALTAFKVGDYNLLDVETPDTLPFFSAAHTFRSNTARTYSNYQSTGAANQDSIEDALATMRGWTNSVGAPLKRSLKTMRVVTPNGQIVEDLERIIGSKLQSDTNGNAINTIYGKMTLEVWDWLTNQNRFYIINTASQYLPRRDYGWKMKREDEDVDNRKGIMGISFTENFAQAPIDGRCAFAIGA